MKSCRLPIYVQGFFTERLTTQLAASPNTVASYRDTFRLLLKYASKKLGREPTSDVITTGWLGAREREPLDNRRPYSAASTSYSLDAAGSRGLSWSIGSIL